MKLPLALVGTFFEPEQFHEASAALTAICPPPEIELVSFAPVAVKPWRRRLHEYLSWLRSPSRLPARACAGVVIVRSAAAFSKASEIIEQCGGCFGLPTAKPS